MPSKGWIGQSCHLFRLKRHRLCPITLCEWRRMNRGALNRTHAHSGRTKMKSMKTLEDLLTHELKDLFSAEKQILKALPKMIKAATSEDLQQALQNHLTETEQQFTR